MIQMDLFNNVAKIYQHNCTILKSDKQTLFQIMFKNTPSASQHLSICHLCLTRQHILKAKIYAVTFINDESNTVMKEEILFYFIMIKQNRTIIEQNIINLLKNIIICTWLMVSPNPPSLVTGLIVSFVLFVFVLSRVDSMLPVFLVHLVLYLFHGDYIQPEATNLWVIHSS
jgi:hypothetical protein